MKKVVVKRVYGLKKKILLDSSLYCFIVGFIPLGLIGKNNIINYYNLKLSLLLLYSYEGTPYIIEMLNG